MSLVGVDHAADKPGAFRKAPSDGVHDTMRATFDVPQDDRFQLLHEEARTATVRPPTDIVINLVEVLKENWFFGNGVAQYAG